MKRVIESVSLAERTTLLAERLCPPKRGRAFARSSFQGAYSVKWGLQNCKSTDGLRVIRV